MGLLLGLFFGIGVLLIIWTFVTPAEEGPADDGRVVTRSRDLLASAGVEGVTPGAFIGVCVLAGVAGFVLMLVVSGAWPVGVVFGLMAGGMPVALLRSRAAEAARGVP